MFYNKTASNYDHRHLNPWTKTLRDAELDMIKNHAYGDVLDVGCGTGFHLKWMETNTGKWKTLVGCDISEEMLKEAGAKVSSKLVLANAEQLPFANMNFDTVLCLFTVLNLCENHVKVLKEMCRVLRPKGIMLLGVTSVWDNEGKKKKVVRIDKSRLCMKLFDSDILRDIERVGFRVAEFDSLFRSARPRWGDWQSNVVDDSSQPIERGAVYLFVLEKIDYPKS
jgi:ubiquinone/menaquinone biosynthesis C-methylase UbiE